jgi:hypothetical protein
MARRRPAALFTGRLHAHDGPGRLAIPEHTFEHDGCWSIPGWFKRFVIHYRSLRRARPNPRKSRLERMSSDDPPQSDPPAAPDDGKVIEMGGAPPPERRGFNRPFRWRLVVGIAVLVAGGGIGYLISDRQSPGDAAFPPDGRSEASAVSAVTSTGATCSMQRGTALSIGVQLVNRAGHAVNLDQMLVELPPGSRLDLMAGYWGPCGTSNPSAQPRAVALEADATTWVSATVATRVPCAIPDPVVFVIDYDGGHKLRVPFNALGDGRYTGCDESTG